MKVRCLGQIVMVLAFGVLAGLVDAEELGFPKSCVELQQMAPEPVPLETFSNRDSVLFRLEVPSQTSAKGGPLTFDVWDTETRKWLARGTAGVLPLHWQFSPDGKLLAMATYCYATVIQLWEVGGKDFQGVPQLRLNAELRRRDVDPKERTDTYSPQYSGRLAWTPDSKTLIAGYGKPGRTSETQVLFGPFTDKSNIGCARPRGISSISKPRNSAKKSYSTETGT